MPTSGAWLVAQARWAAYITSGRAKRILHDGHQVNGYADVHGLRLEYRTEMYEDNGKQQVSAADLK